MTGLPDIVIIVDQHEEYKAHIHVVYMISFHKMIQEHVNINTNLNIYIKALDANEELLCMKINQ